jgi:hypothetical protein
MLTNVGVKAGMVAGLPTSVDLTITKVGKKHKTLSDLMPEIYNSPSGSIAIVPNAGRWGTSIGKKKVCPTSGKEMGSGLSI